MISGFQKPLLKALLTKQVKSRPTIRQSLETLEHMRQERSTPNSKASSTLQKSTTKEFEVPLAFYKNLLFLQIVTVSMVVLVAVEIFL